jgi:hypothetical protein
MTKTTDFSSQTMHRFKILDLGLTPYIKVFYNVDVSIFSGFFGKKAQPNRVIRLKNPAIGN